MGNHSVRVNAQTFHFLTFVKCGVQLNVVDSTTPLRDDCPVALWLWPENVTLDSHLVTLSQHQNVIKNLLAYFIGFVLSVHDSFLRHCSNKFFIVKHSFVNWHINLIKTATIENSSWIPKPFRMITKVDFSAQICAFFPCKLNRK